MTQGLLILAMFAACFAVLATGIARTALTRARRHLDKAGCKDVALVITGGLRKLADFIKAMALETDAVAVSNAAMQATGCIATCSCLQPRSPVEVFA